MLTRLILRKFPRQYFPNLLPALRLFPLLTTQEFLLSSQHIFRLLIKIPHQQLPPTGPVVFSCHGTDIGGRDQHEQIESLLIFNNSG